jgi:hypothetical protein
VINNTWQRYKGSINETTRNFQALALTIEKLDKNGNDLNPSSLSNKKNSFRKMKTDLVRDYDIQDVLFIL